MLKQWNILILISIVNMKFIFYFSVDPCDEVACEFGGTCLTDVTTETYYCECVANRYGELCELTLGAF